MLSVIDEWDESLYRDIAKRSGSKQAIEDVSYARFAFYHNPQQRFSVRHKDIGFALAMIYDDAVRIIGIAVDKKYQNCGYGQQLLHIVENLAKRQRKQRLYIRTLDGYKWFIKKGYTVTGTKGNDYMLEKS